MRIPPGFSLVLLLAPTLARAAVAADSAQRQRGSDIYQQKCLLCHQPTGLGVPGVYPPLAKADWLAADRVRTIRVLCQGLSERITVNGQRFEGAMPAQMLDDRQVADVLTFIGGAWENALAPFTPEEVAEARRGSKFPTYEKLVAAAAYQPLPKPPTGFRVREVAQVPEFCTRMASTPRRPGVYVLAQSGSVFHLDPGTGGLVPVIRPGDYLDPARGSVMALGCTFDDAGRLWITTNQRLEKGLPQITDEVTIWRSSVDASGHPAQLQPWFSVSYPQAAYNHGVSHLAFGPDGKLYVASGSRTDGGEQSKDPRLASGEIDITACLWRLDPVAAKPEIKVLGRGIRNPYAFAWDPAGNLFTFANGPDYSSGEEVDCIEPGRHYGFPYQFADLPVSPGFPYPHTPAPPAGLEFTKPVVNFGPAGGGNSRGLATLDPHSSPGGVTWCGDDFPPPLRGRFLVPRFGNLLGAPACPEDVGFDVLAMRISRDPAGGWRAETESVLAPLGRPLDSHRIGPGRVLILEYTRPTNFKEKLGWLPGRVIELAVDSE